jgi:hypothetical protein
VTAAPGADRAGVFGDGPTVIGTAGSARPGDGDGAARRPLLVSSFDPAALHRVRCTAPQVPLGWLTWHRFPLEAAVAGCAHLDVDVLGEHVGSLPDHPRTGALDAPAVARTLSLVHGCGRELLVWCPEPAPARCSPRPVRTRSWWTTWRSRSACSTRPPELPQTGAAPEPSIGRTAHHRCAAGARG